jgi:hypothetical protein
LKNYDFALKSETNLTHYLSYRIFVNYETRAMYVMQPHAIKNLEKKFRNEDKKIVIMEHLQRSNTFGRIDPELPARHRSETTFRE